MVMKLARFRYKFLESYGIVLDDLLIPKERLEKELGLTLPCSLDDLIALGGVDLLRRAMDSTSRGFRLEDVELLAPLRNPPKMIFLGLNYMSHVREQNARMPGGVVIFLKPRTSIAGPFEEIEVPSDYTSKVDYEGELALIIGRRCRRVDREDALDFVLGYTVVNDVSARDIQFADKQWTRGKSLDKFAPMGPWIVTADEVGDPHNLRIRTRLNEELMQDCSTSDMIFKISDVISELSRGMTLEPGDLIATGTPAGVGIFRNPPVLIEDGDVVEIEVERVGRIRNRFRFV